MLANYGYQDQSGAFFITIDTDKCDGCGACRQACPSDCFEVILDAYDPDRQEPVAVVSEARRKDLARACAPCKPDGAHRPLLPCQEACSHEAIRHSW